MRQHATTLRSRYFSNLLRSSPTAKIKRLAILMSCSFAIGATAAVEPPNREDLTQGSWEIIHDKSTFCKPRPQESRRDIVDVGWGLISVHWTGKDHEGKPINARYVWRYDGDKYPADIIKPAQEAISWGLINPNRVEFLHWSKDGEITEELYREVSPDGQEMTQSRKYLGGEGECVDIQVFKRI